MSKNTFFLMAMLCFGSVGLLKAQNEIVHFFDDFESGTLTHWTVIDGNHDDITWENCTYSDNMHYASSVSRKRESTSDYLISPLLEDVTRITFKAWSGQYSEDYFKVMVSTTDLSLNSFTSIYSNSVGDTWEEFNVALPSDTKYVAIYHYYYGPYDEILFIDDVTIYGTVNNHIYSVNVDGFTAPKWGAHPDFELNVPSNAHCSISNVVWYLENTSTTFALTVNDIFNKDNVMYYMYVLLAPASGYSFVNYTKVYFNGSLTPFDVVNSRVMSDGKYRAWTIEYQVKSGAGVDEQSTEQAVLWPNPANNVLYLNVAEGEMVSVYDNTGRLVLNERYVRELNIGSLAKGVYAVTAAGHTVKFVKE